MGEYPEGYADKWGQNPGESGSLHLDYDEFRTAVSLVLLA